MRGQAMAQIMQLDILYIISEMKDHRRPFRDILVVLELVSLCQKSGVKIAEAMASSRRRKNRCGARMIVCGVSSWTPGRRIELHTVHWQQVTSKFW